MNRLPTALVSAAALWVAACSSGGGPTINPPPPTGKFTLASLNGTYAFTTSGEVFTNGSFTPTPMVRVGSFTADSKGGISRGVEDVNASGAVNSPIFINSSGSGYTVSPDGRGTLTLSGASGGNPFTINFGFVLTSGSDGLSVATDGILIDETSTQTQASTGSGNFVLQTPPFQTTAISGTYVFDFSGLDSGGFPESIVGEISVTTGGITSGVEDADDNFALSSGGTGTGSFISDPSNPATLTSSGRGLATIAGETYAFYIVDSNRVRLISIGTGANTPPMLSGDAVLQTSVPASLSGGFAFVVAGTDARGGITRVGRFSASAGASSNVSNVMMDTNDSDSFHLTGGSGNPAVSNASVTLDSTTGRGILMFMDPKFSGPSTFVFYLTSANSGVIQETSLNNGVPIVVADGSIAAQSGSPFTSSNIAGNYAMNWSGLVTAQGNGITDEEDLVGLVNVSNLSLSGRSDLFQFTSSTLNPSTNIGTGGQIMLNGAGDGSDGKRVDMTVNLSGPQLDMVVYVVDPQTAFFANRVSNSGRTIVGILKAQK